MRILVGCHKKIGWLLGVCFLAQFSACARVGERKVVVETAGVQEARGEQLKVLEDRFEKVWDMTFTSPIRTSSLQKNCLYVECLDKTVYALDRETGEALWQHKLKSPLTFAPIESPTATRETGVDMYEFYDNTIKEFRRFPVSTFTKRLLMRDERLALRKVAGTEATSDQRVTLTYTSMPEETYVYDFYDPILMKKRAVLTQDVRRVQGAVVSSKNYKTFLPTRPMIIVLDGQTGRALREISSLDVDLSTPPVASDRSIYGGDRVRSAFLRYDTDKWRLDWIFSMADMPASKPIYAEGILYVVTKSGKMIALKESSSDQLGEQLWVRPLTEDITDVLKVRGRLVYAFVYAIEGNRIYYYYRLPKPGAKDDKEMIDIGHIDQKDLYDDMTNLRLLGELKAKLSAAKEKNMSTLRVEIEYDPRDYYNCRLLDTDSRTDVSSPVTADITSVGDYIFAGSQNENLYVINRLSGEISSRICLKDAIQGQIIPAADVTANDLNGELSRQLSKKEQEEAIKNKTINIRNSHLRLYVVTEHGATERGLRCIEMKIAKNHVQGADKTLQIETTEQLRDLWQENKEGVGAAPGINRFLFEGRREAYALDKEENLVALDRNTGRKTWEYKNIPGSTSDQFLRNEELLTRNLYLVRHGTTVALYREKITATQH